jgi:hypothetical protein
VNSYCISDINRAGLYIYDNSNLDNIIEKLEGKSVRDIFNNTLYHGDKENLTAFRQAVEICGHWELSKSGVISRKANPVVMDLTVLIPFAICVLATMALFITRCSG